MKKLYALFRPNQTLDRQTNLMMVVFQIALALAVWIFSNDDR